jgi:hypothetical protein
VPCVCAGGRKHRHPIQLAMSVQVGDVATDHNKTDNQPVAAEQYNNIPVKRPVHFITNNNPGADLIAEVVSAFASCAMLFEKPNNELSLKLTARARSLYAWMTKDVQSAKSYSLSNFKDFNSTYPSDTPHAHMMLAAAWMNKLTREEKYAQDAETFFAPARRMQV